VVTAAALFDGHDAAINLVRRLLVRLGAEVVHLGHNRSARDVAQAAIEEDADAVAVSSYQGGHNEFFPYLRRLLDASAACEVPIFAGGGGVILPHEVKMLESSGVAKVFTPEDGRRLGLEGMVRSILDAAQPLAERRLSPPSERVSVRRPQVVARAISFLESGGVLGGLPLGPVPSLPAPVLGVTGTGGAGKSSLIDELVLRFLEAFPALAIAVLAVDPTKRRTGGALLGDRLRMNAGSSERVYLRSFASRGGAELSPALNGAIEVLRRAGYGLVIVETAGIGQGASAVVEVSDLSLYVMTSDFGASTQLEKIDMLDFAQLVALNKADRSGAADALREVKRHTIRSRGADAPAVLATSASRHNDPGVNDLFAAVLEQLRRRAGDRQGAWTPTGAVVEAGREPDDLIPHSRERHLGEAAEAVRAYHRHTSELVESCRDVESARRVARLLDAQSSSAGDSDGAFAARLGQEEDRLAAEAAEGLSLLESWESTRARYEAEVLKYSVRGGEVSAPTGRRTLSGLRLPRIALPPFDDKGEILRFLRDENLPGQFPFTAGVFPLKREDEMPTRQFAGEGSPERTNRRFHLLTRSLGTKRLSVAFDSVTLYGADPDERPDIYGKIGESGVSVATQDDMAALFDGFDLVSPQTSVSMTINGPAPIILAMFFNAAIDQELRRFRRERGLEPDGEEKAAICSRVLREVRGTVQADILKEDQAQNTCIFSTRFALRLMGDVQQFFVDEGVRNFYSVSISGYHIAEAGANPITQLALTLANGLTYLEYYRRRGMRVDDFAPNFSFFFSNGLEAEYAVLGRVARRVWAIVLRDLYGAGERSQKLKYHIQTSGRSLHAREMAFNDIRTTLQALMAIYDHCNSLHTNAYDEAVTTPTHESVRRALAIQLIIQKELGLAKNENPLQGSFIIEELTRRVEEAVLAEFDRISERGGVLGAMESGYLRGRIQEESLRYEELKHSGDLEIVGVNTFLDDSEDAAREVPAVRAAKEEKDREIQRLREFQRRNAAEKPAALRRLKDAALGGGNVFRELMNTVRYASLGEVTQALFEVGGEYRRTM
jgi:methylmalonyl-CoA mutase